MKEIELLAPAGDLERLKTAVRYGANAVYIGGKELSLRSRASNFSMEDIKEGCAFAKQYGAKVHVTVNMIPHDDDFGKVVEYLQALQDAGVHAIICASITIMKLCKQYAPKIEVHVSTQQTSTNSRTIAYWKRVGADRVVLAREMSLKDIREISQNASLETEVFIHGAMCVNYSGRCTLSNRMTLRDANRGGCAQSCRWKYRLYDKEEEISLQDCLYSMSSKDLQAVAYIPALMDANVSSLKIEGRMKTAYYIACVVGTYRRAIDEYAKTGTITSEHMQMYVKELAKAENRPSANGFYEALPTKDTHLYGVNGAGVMQDYVANVVDYDKETQMATIQVRNHFTPNTTLEVMSPTIFNETFVPEHLYDEKGNEVEVANKPMQILRCKIPFVVQKDDFVRRVSGV